MPRGKVNDSGSTGEMTMKATTEPMGLPEQQYQMIAEAAFFRAEHRGFRGGDPLQDWLEAEQEINLSRTTEHSS